MDYHADIVAEYFREHGLNFEGDISIDNIKNHTNKIVDWDESIGSYKTSERIPPELVEIKL